MAKLLQNRTLLPQVAASGIALSLTLLGGCAPDPLPVLSPAPEPSGPVLNLDQTGNVLDQVSAALAAAESARNPELLADRLTGPALALRTSQLEVAAIRDDNAQVTAIPDTFQQIILPVTEGWPRTMFAITDFAEQAQLPSLPPRLLALVQTSAREPYRLWGWVQLVPGDGPPFADPRLGSEEVAPNDGTDLVMSPAEAVRQYANLIVQGPESQFTGNFQPQADDPLRDWWAGWSSAQAEAIQGERIEGTYSLTANPDPEIKAIRSAEGGAMVMAAIYTSERLEAMEGAVLAPQTATAQALLYGQEFTNVLTADYIDMIALYIPAAGSGQRISLIGYSHIQTGASVGDPYDEAEEEAATD